MIHFVLEPRQQSFEEEAEISPIKIKIKNDKIQNMFEKYKKYVARLRLEGSLFSSSMKKDTEKIFLTTNGLVDAKYNLIDRILYQVIGIINLNKIKNWNEIKKSRQVYVNFSG